MTRRRGLAAIAGLVGLGMLAAGLLGVLPESARVLAALALLLVLPVCVFEPVLRPHAGGAAETAPLRILLAFLAWLSILALWTAAFTLAGTSFRTYALATVWLVIALLGTAGTLAFARPRVARSAPASARRWMLLIAACAAFAALIPHHLPTGEDGLDHVGYIRRIGTDDTMRPAGVLAPRVEEPAAWPDPRKGVFHPMLALVAITASADPVVVWRWLPVFIFPAVVVSAIAFNAAFLPSQSARVLAAVLLVLSFHGSLIRFASASIHGETLAAMFGWTLAAAVLAAPPQRAWSVYGALAAGGVSIHLGVTLHALVLAVTVACFGSGWGMARRERARVAGALAAGTALALLMRYRDLAGPVNAIHAHIQGVLFVTERWFVVSPVEILRRDGMLFLGALALVPTLFFAARTRREPRAMLAFAAIPCALSFVPWLATPLYERGSYMVFRSLLNVPVFAVIAYAALWWAGAARRRERWALWVGVPVATVWLLVFFRPVPHAIVHEARTRAGAARENAGLSPALLRAVAVLPARSVILSDPATSYVLSAYTPHRFVTVYQQHGNPRDPFALDRLEAVRDAMSPLVAPDRAVDACRRYGVEYVLVNGAPPRDISDFLSVWGSERYGEALRRLASMDGSFARMDSAGGATLYRFERTAPVNRWWSPQEQPVVVADLPLAACEIDAPDDVFRITGVSVFPSRALPGDTVRVTLGYRRDILSPFALPMLMHARFDHQAPGTPRAYPGDKLVRRRADRKAGLLSRFRADLRPGHGAYEPDIWPTGLPLCETFDVVIPANARLGEYRIEISVARDSLLPNFHLRDFFFNRDHYSGSACTSLVVDKRTVGDS